MKTNKRGVELTLNTVILAILALMVLVVVALIFLKGSNYFVDKLKTVWDQIIGLKPNLSSAVQK